MSHDVDSDGGRPGRLTRTDLLRGAAVGGLLLASGADAAAAVARAGTSPAAAKPKRGGTLRVGMSGATNRDSADPANTLFSPPDDARYMNLYDGLVKRDENLKVVNALAESIEANKNSTVWTVRLKDGIEFHNGKTVSADDVIFSFQRQTHPKSSSASVLKSIDPKGFKKLDSRTVRINMKTPFATFPRVASLFWGFILPVGFDPKHAVGTGPFKLKSFTPGERTVLTRFDNYWGGAPYVDELQMIPITDGNARVNAFLSGQIDVIHQVPAAQLKAIKGSGEVVMTGPSSNILPFMMRSDMAPFSDPRVRLAMKLIIDRRQIVDQIFDGQATVANDMSSPFDPCLARPPQHAPDIERAKSLLKQAGMSDLHVEFTTTEIIPGNNEAAQLLAQQAKAAGVTIDVRTLDFNAFVAKYTQWPFTVDYYTTPDFLVLTGVTMAPGAPYNAGHFNDPEFNSLYQQALREGDPVKNCALVKQLSTIQYQRGPTIVWAALNFTDAHSKKVLGLRHDKWLPLGRYNFSRASFA